MKITEIKDGCILEVSVKPRSKRFEILVEADEVVVRCTEEPVEGRVNRELMKELSRLFHKRVDLVFGSTSKNKKLFVKGATKNDVEKVLKNE